MWSWCSFSIIDYAITSPRQTRRVMHCVPLSSPPNIIKLAAGIQALQCAPRENIIPTCFSSDPCWTSTYRANDSIHVASWRPKTMTRRRGHQHLTYQDAVMLGEISQLQGRKCQPTLFQPEPYLSVSFLKTCLTRRTSQSNSDDKLQ